MRRWNGWGDDAITYPLPASARRFLEQKVGKGNIPRVTRLDEILAQVPKTRLPKHPLVLTDPLTRILHSRGQSFPNWIDLRYGHIRSLPDGVAYPMSEDDVVTLIQYALQKGIH